MDAQSRLRNESVKLSCAVGMCSRGHQHHHPQPRDRQPRKPAHAPGRRSPPERSHPERLCDLYDKQGLEPTHIARLASCSPDTVRARQIHDKVPLQPRPDPLLPPRPDITRAWLHSEYVGKRRTIHGRTRPRTRRQPLPPHHPGQRMGSPHPQHRSPLQRHRPPRPGLDSLPGHADRGLIPPHSTGCEPSSRSPVTPASPPQPEPSTTTATTPSNTKIEKIAGSASSTAPPTPSPPLHADTTSSAKPLKSSTSPTRPVRNPNVLWNRVAGRGKPDWFRCMTHAQSGSWGCGGLVRLPRSR